MHINKINAYADFWYHEIGVNVIPAKKKKKKPLVAWKDDPRINMQTEPIPQSMHDEWKNKGIFRGGMAVICGKVFRGEHKGKYLCAVDADNQMGIDSLSTKGIREVAKKTLVEQHPNTPHKAHFYFYTTKPMPKKSSDAVDEETNKKMKSNQIPAIEMKGEGKHGIMYCSPSPHEDGSNYEILGIDEPMILDDIGDVVNKICNQYSLGKASNNLVSMKLLMDNDTKVLEGNNRHEAIMRYAESILRKYPSIEDQIFRDMIYAKNSRMCSPPLSNDQVEIQIKCAIDFIAKQVEEEKKLKEIDRQKFGTPEFWSDVDLYVKAFHPKKLFIRCLECKKLIDANPLEQDHYGHVVEIK